MTRGVATAVAVFTLSTLLYANSLANGFALDDRVAVERNPLIRDLSEIPTLFASDYWAHFVSGGLYRPLVTTSFALNYAAGGLDPFGYHAVNVLLYGVVALLVLALYRRLTPDPVVAALAALFFAAHAIHTEAVANVVGRAELMCGAGLLAALLTHIRVKESPSPTRLWLGPCFYALALLSKESAIILIGLLVLYDFAYAETSWNRRRWVTQVRTRYASYLAVTGVYLVIRTIALQTDDPNILSATDNPLIDLDAPWATLSALWVSLRYLALLIAPIHLSYDYSYAAIPLIDSPVDLRWIAAVAVAIAILAALPRAYRASRPLFFAMGFGLLSFSIVSNWVLTIGTLLGERLLFVPSVGFCLAAALIGRGLSDRLATSQIASTRILVAAFALLIAAHGWRTVERNPEWQSDATVFLAALDVNPGSVKVQHNAAMTLVRQNRFEEALPHVERALEIVPSSDRSRGLLGHILMALGRGDEAMVHYELAVRSGSEDPRVYNNLGFALLERDGEAERAVELIARAVALEPDNPHFLDSLGWAHYRLGQLDEAREYLVQSLEIDSSGVSGDKRRAHLAEIEDAIRRSAGGSARGPQLPISQ